jgi:hypothetical protein
MRPGSMDFKKGNRRMGGKFGADGADSAPLASTEAKKGRKGSKKSDKLIRKNQKENVAA